MIFFLNSVFLELNALMLFVFPSVSPRLAYS